LLFGAAGLVGMERSLVGVILECELSNLAEQALR